MRRHFPVTVDESGTLVFSFQGLQDSNAAVAAIEVISSADLSTFVIVRAASCNSVLILSPPRF